MSQTATRRKETACACAQTVAKDPMMPRPFVVKEIRRELPDTCTMTLRPQDGGKFVFAPGQFNMLYVFGVGEVPISITGDSKDSSVLVHTTRSVGKVSQAINALKAGDIVGVRGPFGTFWPVSAAQGKDVVFVAGGMGLVPLRPAIYQVMNERSKFNRFAVLYGMRTPEEFLFESEVTSWRKRLDMEVLVTVDKSTGDWKGRVGRVTTLIPAGGFDPANTVVFTCGPEIMMVNTLKELAAAGIPEDRMFLSMERNMKCGVGLCGHCQWGSVFVCRHGPVFRYDQVSSSLKIKEL